MLMGVEVSPKNQLKVPLIKGDLGGSSLVDQLVIDRIIRVWESNDEQVHFQTIADRVMADESIAGAVLGLYQRMLAEKGAALDASQEQLALRLTGLVVKKGDRIQISNRIYQQIFNRDWIAKKFLALRPYGQALQQWEATNRDPSLLLQGTALQDARSWSKDKQLAAIDREFLEMSRDVEYERELKQKDQQLQLEQEAKQKLQEANQTLEIAQAKAQKQVIEAEESRNRANARAWEIVENSKITLKDSERQFKTKQQKANRRLRIGTGILALSLLGVGCAGLFWKIADIRIASLTTKDLQQEGDVGQSLIQSLHAQQQVKSLDVLDGLPIPPYQVAAQSVAKSATIVLSGQVRMVDRLDHRPSRNWLEQTQSQVQTWWHSIQNPSQPRQEVSSDVNSVAFSPDGNTIASGSGDKTVKLWRRDGTLLTTLKGHENSVMSVAFSPDGNTIASGSDDKTVKLWRRDGTLLTTLKGHENYVNSVAFSPDGNTIASGSWDNTVKLWETQPWDDASQFALGCYWLKDMMNEPDLQGLQNDCNNANAKIPPLLISQAHATALLGNFNSAQTLLEEAKARDPKLSIDHPLATARKTAAQALLWQAEGRVKFERREAIVANPADLTKNFDFLTQAYLEEANFLVRRAKAINPELNVEQEMKRVRDKWKASVDELRMKK